MDFSYPEGYDVDTNHIWHPYSPLSPEFSPYNVAYTEKNRIVLHSGEKLIDAMSSWWSAIHGYGNQEIINAATLQLNKMSHVMFGGLTHEPAKQLTKTLLEILPSKDLNAFFYCDSGSISVEVAIKMALQYQFSKNSNTSKKKLLTVKGGYHGDSLGAMSVCDPENGMHAMYRSFLPKHFFAKKPTVGFYEKWSSSSTDEIKTLIRNYANQIAAFVVEPIVQGAGGMSFYHPQFLNEIFTLCKENDILIIFDEIATGFGRTGKLFAFEYCNFEPDILCIGKAITGGFLSFAATICTQKIAKTISEGSLGAFMHGPTFMANPLACTIASKNIEILKKSPWEKQTAFIGSFFYEQLSHLKEKSCVKDVRSLGGIGVIEFSKNLSVKKTTREFVKKGVWVRPFKNLLYIMPPYSVEKKELETIINTMKYVVERELFC